MVCTRVGVPESRLLHIRRLTFTAHHGNLQERQLKRSGYRIRFRQPCRRSRGEKVGADSKKLTMDRAAQYSCGSFQRTPASSPSSSHHHRYIDWASEGFRLPEFPQARRRSAFNLVPSESMKYPGKDEPCRSDPAMRGWSKSSPSEPSQGGPPC